MKGGMYVATEKSPHLVMSYHKVGVLSTKHYIYRAGYGPMVVYTKFLKNDVNLWHFVEI